MPQAHSFPCELLEGTGSKALWSLQPEGKHLVFVHGFSGSTQGSWAGDAYD